MLRTTLTTLSFLSRNVASIGKLIKNVWIALHFRMSIPSSGARSFVPMSPRARCGNVRATLARIPLTTTVSITSDHCQYGGQEDEEERRNAAGGG